MTAARAFSLIEALAATALLAIVAAACLPILSAASRMTDDPARTIDPGSLGELADRIAASPVSFGVVENHVAYTIEWPEDLAHDAPQVNAIVYTNAALEPPRADGGQAAPEERWLSLTCGARASVRWLPPPESSRRTSRSPRYGTRRRPRSAVSVRRGLTLVETLVALAVTALLAVTVVSWTVGSTQTAAKLERAARAGTSTESVLRLLSHELACGDFELPRRGSSPDGPRSERVRIEGSSLIIQGRRPDRLGDAVRRYMLDSRARVLIAIDEPADSARTGSANPVRHQVAEGVKEFTVREEGTRNGRKPHVLVVTVGLDEGNSVTRRLAIP